MVTICKDRDDAEKEMDKLKTGFITPDHRIYDSVVFSDEWSYYECDSKTFYALHDLQSQIKMLDNGSLETSFSDLIKHAKELESCFKKVKQLIKTKPIIKRSK